MKYSAQDIARMRKVCVALARLQMGSWRAGEDAMAAEHMLVTYMSNETTPDELEREHGLIAP